jgi:hypothetical protein
MLIIMILMWILTSMNNLIINIYLKYIPGNVFINISVAAAAEIAASLSVGVIIKSFGTKWTFAVGFAIALAGGFALIFQEKFLT